MKHRKILLSLLIAFAYQTPTNAGKGMLWKRMFSQAAPTTVNDKTNLHKGCSRAGLFFLSVPLMVMLAALVKRSLKSY